MISGEIVPIGKLVVFVGLLLHWEKVEREQLKMPHSASPSTAHAHIPTLRGSCYWLLATVPPPVPPGDTLPPSTPGDAGTGGCRAALLTRGPSLACDFVLPGPSSVVFS